jgi:hypothetical protein
MNLGTLPPSPHLTLALIWLGGLDPDYLKYGFCFRNFQNTMHLE